MYKNEDRHGYKLQLEARKAYNSEVVILALFLFSVYIFRLT